MKKIILFVMLLMCISFAQSGYYVSTTASGSGDGSSWANADLYTDNFWGNLSAGDTLFIDGGTDSLVYSSGFNVGASGSWNNYIYMLSGKFSPSSSGHDGRVIIENGSGIGIYFDSQHWWYVKGLEVRNTSSDGIKFHNTSRHIVIDSVDVWQCGGFGIYGNGASCGGGQNYNMDSWDSTDVVYDITIKNSSIRSFRDEWPNTDDLVQFTCARDIKIHDNIILNNNLQTERGASEHIHQDDIQTFCVQGIKIYNNVLVVDSGAMGHNLILSTQSRDGSEYSGLDECIIYNNMIYHGGHLISGGYPATQHLFLRWYDSSADMAPTYVFHNTIVWANGSGEGIAMERKGIFKNNIIYHYGTYGQNPSVYGGTALDFWTSVGSFTTQVDSQSGNLMYSEWTTNNDFIFGTYLPNFVGAGGSPTGSPEDLDGWVNDYGGDVVNENPLFVDTLWNDGTPNSFVVESNSPAIDAGLLSSWIESFLTARDLPITDHFGNSRDANWDIGAFEYIDALAVDSLPNVFTINDVANAELSTEYSDAITLAGFDSAYAYFGGYNYTVNGGSVQTGYTKVFPSDEISIYRTSSSSYSTAVNTTLTVGSRSDVFTITTKSAPVPSSPVKTIRLSNDALWKDSSGKLIRPREE